ncbi:hypothetical protein [Mycolicibacterium septicum]|uniref:hypothetical protein n=1 Tax=Mycolicibacterium septicum TaxID=98668 RepID=UPI002361B12A|nr:hypothetical protein [Mycolicibacterium septicum]
MEESPASSRIDKAEPFHIELDAAFTGVSQAIAAVEELRASEELASFSESYYGRMIGSTLIVEVDRLRDVVDSVLRRGVDSRINRGSELHDGADTFDRDD